MTKTKEITTSDETTEGGNAEFLRTEPVYVTLRPWEKRALDLLSKLEGRSRSDLLRHLAVPWLQQQVESRDLHEEVAIPELLQDEAMK